MKISGIVCGMLMTVALCLQKKWNYVMECTDRNMAINLECNRPLSEESTRFYAAQLTVAVEFLHKCGIIHR